MYTGGGGRSQVVEHYYATIPAEICDVSSFTDRGSLLWAPQILMGQVYRPEALQP